MNRILQSFCLLYLLFPTVKAQLLPPGLPQISMVYHDATPLCDYLYTEILTWATPNATNLLLIFDQNGEVVWYTASTQVGTNFAVQPNGQMSFFRQGEHVLLDNTFSVVGGVGCDGSLNDAHDLIITTDGRVFQICLASEIAELSSLNTANGNPGAPNGILLTTVIQEMDLNMNLVREWRAKPHYNFTDTDTEYFTVPNRLDFNHPNSLDWDGRYLLVSHRHNNEIISLDWDAGQIAWRLGGTQNQFNFTNDQGLSGQHDARFHPGGKISVFDNGTFHNPPLTRGLIYQLDTVSMTATRTDEYPLSGAVSVAMGGFRILPTGDVLRANGWFEPTGAPNISLIHPGGQPAVDIYFPADHFSYRAQCFSPSWQISRPQIQCEPFGNGLRLYLNQMYSDYLWSTGETTASIVVQDTGRYQVFLPMGEGRLGSQEFHIADLNGQCPAVSTPEASEPTHRPGKLLRIIDLLGREVKEIQKGQVYIEIYDDGRRVKGLRTED